MPVTKQSVPRIPKYPRNCFRLTVLMSLSLFGISGHAASLSIGSSGLTFNAGDTGLTAISLNSEGSAISGLQIDLQWDSSLSVQVIAGDQLRSASKNLYLATLAPSGI